MEIYKNNKKVKVPKKITLQPLNLIDIDFSSIKELRGDKTVLEFHFQNQKLESLSNG
jgi:hypothetical protein